MTSISPRQLLESVADSLRKLGTFAGVEVTEESLRCEARESAAPAFYRLWVEEGRLYVGLETADRWLSQSIEADLVHTGDKVPDLLDEELAELGCALATLAVEHFRSDAKLFTFRSPLPIGAREWAKEPAAELAGKCILAYHACFLRLGDMNASEEEA